MLMMLKLPYIWEQVMVETFSKVFLVVDGWTLNSLNIDTQVETLPEVGR